MMRVTVLALVLALAMVVLSACRGEAPAEDCEVRMMKFYKYQTFMESWSDPYVEPLCVVNVKGGA